MTLDMFAGTEYAAPSEPTEYHGLRRFVSILPCPCGARTSAVSEVAYDTIAAGCRECGARVWLRAIKGTTNDTPCDHRCTSARGHVCQCSCGGKNHGRAYAIPAHVPPRF